MSDSATGTPSRKYPTHCATFSVNESSIRSTTGAGTDDGKGHNGGVWEWTSTVLAKYEGFVPSRLYPG